MVPPIPSEVERLKLFLLGHLSVDEVEILVSEYADDSRLSELAEAIGKPDDTLLTDLRQSSDSVRSERGALDRSSQATASECCLPSKRD